MRPRSFRAIVSPPSVASRCHRRAAGLLIGPRFPLHRHHQYGPTLRCRRSAQQLSAGRDRAADWCQVRASQRSIQCLVEPSPRRRLWPARSGRRLGGHAPSLALRARAIRSRAPRAHGVAATAVLAPIIPSRGASSGPCTPGGCEAIRGCTVVPPPCPQFQAVCTMARGSSVIRPVAGAPSAVRRDPNPGICPTEPPIRDCPKCFSPVQPLWVEGSLA